MATQGLEGLEESGFSTLPKGIYVATVLYASNLDSKGELAVRAGVTRRLEVGADFTRTGEVLPLLNYGVQKETETRPGLLVGLGLNATGGTDSAFQAVASKNLTPFGVKETMGYLGAVQDVDGGNPRPLGGLAYSLRENAAAFLQYDGRNYHAGVQAQFKGFNVALMAVSLEEPGLVVARAGLF